ncbi:hypothetical protein HYY73_00015 [Candidatus Woesearchaeota archaeon]|nr:hypothetical protein [Candidatus Woesearchaeota archaeon]
MKLRKTIGKILALGTGAVMVGATILSATAAADLKNYPDPFVKDGKFNAVLVVGDGAASSDVVGSIDVSNALQYASRVKKTIQSTGGGQVSLSGADAWRVQQGAKKLEFSERLDAGTQSTKQENIRNITTFISKDELPTLLADGTFSNTQGDYDYRQYIYFDSQLPAASTGNPIMLSVVYAEDPDNSKSADYLFIDGQSGNSIARYSLEFTEIAKSDTTDSAGAVAASGNYLWNFEGKSIKMLGKDWSIVKARTDATTHASVDLTLMGGATKDVLSEGDTKTYTIGGKDYEVTLDFVGSTTTKFTINGEVSDSLQEGNTQTLKDGTQLGIRDIISQEFAGGVRKTEFYLGADKVRLHDTAAGSAASASGEQTLEVGTETITGTKVTIVAGNTSTTSMTLSSIAINITADQDYYVPAGGKLTQKLRKPQALLNAWDIEYAGLDPVPTEKIKLTPSGSTQYYLEFTDAGGKNAKLPLAYASGSTSLKLGDSDDDLVLNENQSITKNDYFVVTDSSQQVGQRKTYALRYLSAIGSGESSPKLEFQDLGTGSAVSVDYKAADNAVGGGTADATLKHGGGTFRIWNFSPDVNSNFQLKIDLDGDGTIETAGTNESAADMRNVINITTKGGTQILTQHQSGVNNNAVANSSRTGSVDSGGGLILSMQVLDADDYDNVAPSNVEFNISVAGTKVDIAEHTVTTDLKYVTPSADTNIRQTYTSLGSFIDWKTVSNDPDSLTIESPVKSQRLPIVVVTAPGASVTKTAASEAGQIVYYETSPIEVGTAKLASEVADITAQNAIVVGGPCANAAAASLMGNPANCAEGFTEGKAMVKLVESANGKVALLVAGASAMDTRRAARVLADYAKWQEKGVLKGMEVEVAGTSFTDITVGAPAPKVVAPVVEAPAAEAPAPAK